MIDNANRLYGYYCDLEFYVIFVAISFLTCELSNTIAKRNLTPTTGATRPKLTGKYRSR
jgi:hypothetical protein